MGVIQRQTLKNNTFAFAGVGIGMLSRFFLYPLDPELSGYTDAILNAALLLVPFITVGTTTVMVRYFSYLEGPNEKANAGQLLARSLLVSTGVLSLLATFNWVAGNWLDKLFLIGVLHDSRWLIFGVVAALTYAGIFTSHLLNFKRIAIPVIFNNVLLKIGVPVLFLLVALNYLPRERYGIWLMVIYGLAAAGVLGYASMLKTIKLSWGKLSLPPLQRKDLYSLALFGIFGAIGSRLAMYIDTLSINSILDNADTSFYSLAKIIVGVIIIPSTAINAITSPIVANAWRENDMNHLSFLYRETSMVLFAFGGLILTGAIVCMPLLYGIIPNLEQYRVGYVAIFFLGGGQLIDLMTSINGNLIGMTDYFRWNVIFILLLGIFNAALNYFFIAILDYGITGAAISTAISLVLYNLVKVLFVYWKMGMHPFSVSLLYTSLVLLLSGLIAWYLPLTTLGYVDVGLRGLVILIAFLLYLRFTNAVPAGRRLLTQGVKAAFTQ